MLLTPGAHLHSEAQAALEDHKADIYTVRILGGESAIGPATRFRVRAVLE